LEQVSHDDREEIHSLEGWEVVSSIGLLTDSDLRHDQRRRQSPQLINQFLNVEGGAPPGKHRDGWSPRGQDRLRQRLQPIRGDPRIDTQRRQLSLRGVPELWIGRDKKNDRRPISTLAHGQRRR
jgi:hypothetical protein